MKTRKRTEETFQTVRIRRETIPVLQEVIDTVSSHGWSAIGSDRSDRPSQAAVIDEAIRRLHKGGKR